MRQNVDPMIYANLSRIEEDHMLADIEGMIEGSAADTGTDLDEASNRPNRRRYPLVLVSALVLIAALVPAGLMNSGRLVRVAHQITSE